METMELYSQRLDTSFVQCRDQHRGQLPMVLPFKGNSLIIVNTWFVQQLHENKIHIETKDIVRKHLVVCELVYAAWACCSFQQSCASNIN